MRGQLPHEREVRPVPPAGLGDLVGPAGAPEPLPQIVQQVVVDIEAVRLGLEGSHVLDRAGGGAAGKCTVTRSPPAARGVRVRVPSCAWVMLLTIASPRPTPAWSVRMRSVPRRNGSPSVVTNRGVSFSPVFSTVSTTLLG